jgi:hypothetical protein
MSLPRRVAVAAAAVAFGVALAVAVAPAAANEAAGVVHGKELGFDDWNDEGIVSASSHSYSNLAGMWQAILWADKSLRSDGKPWAISDIDCRFGPETTYSTKRWQNRYDHLEVDGAVGNNTFTAAGWSMNFQEDRGTAEYQGQTAAGEYTGRNVGFVRNSAGEWAMYLNGDLKKIWYKSATFNQC